MRITAIEFATALFALTASGQTVMERTLTFAHTETTQNMQEIATAIRSIAEPQQADVAQASLTLRGTADQIALAEWLFAGLDLPVSAQANAPTREYRLSTGSDNLVRLYYLGRGQSVQEFQEFTTLCRTIAEIRRVFTYNAPRIIAVRGTADQLAMADWLASELVKPNNGPRPHSVSNEYRLPASPSPTANENIVRLFYLAHAATMQDFQEAATLMRTIAEVRRVFTYNAPRAIAFRGTGDQLEFVQWLFNELDQPRTSGSSHESALYNYQGADATDNATRVFYLPHTATIQEFQTIATEIRKSANIRRVFTYNTPRAVAVRGTLNQLEHTELLLKQLDPVDFPAAQ